MTDYIESKMLLNLDAMMYANDPPDRGQTRELRRFVAPFQQQN